MKQSLHVKSIRSRPRLKAYSYHKKEEVEEIMQQLLEKNPDLGGFVGKLGSVIRVRKEKTKYWSPQLSLKLEYNEDRSDVLELRGIFGPRPSVWTFFMFLYGFAGALALTVGIYGAVEMALKIGSFWIWSLPVSFLIAALTYAAARYGQYLSRNQLERLHQFVDEIYKQGDFYDHLPKSLSNQNS